MIYLVTRSQELFTNDAYKIIGVDESLSLLSKCSILQADSETTGKDPHICKLLCFQLGSIDKSWQIIIDCLTIDIKLYKEVLESKYLIFQNGKFDLQFLFNHNIIPPYIDINLSSSLFFRESALIFFFVTCLRYDTSSCQYSPLTSEASLKIGTNSITNVSGNP